jgi:predicted permease
MLKVFWRYLRGRQGWETGLNQEIQEHIEHRTRALIEQGVPSNEAARRARLEFGSLDAYKERCREEHGLRWPSELGQDLRYGVRMLRRNRAFTAIAVLSLALGIGANMVVFGVVNGLLLRPLPIADPERVYSVDNGNGLSQSFPNYRDLRDRNSVFDSLFAYRITTMALETGGEANRVWGYLVTGNYFESLGIHPALGRFFSPREDLQVNASPWAVLSFACWQNRFGADPQIAGRTVHINGYAYTVLGVAPQGFRGTEVFYASEIWVPMSMQPQIEGRSWLEERSDFNSWVAGRLKPGISPGEANANVSALASQLAREHKQNEGMRLSLSRPGLVGSLLRDPARAFAGGVMFLAALVLLAASTNLACLLGVRSADRYRELAIRLSIGASRGRLVRQLATEAIPISLLGGAAGCAVASALLGALSRWRAIADFPIQFDVRPDYRVFLFAFLATLVTGVFFGIAPARQAWRTDPNSGLKGRGSGSAVRRWSFRDAGLAAQVALCCLLIMSSFVALRGLVQSLQTPLGMQPAGAAVAGIDLGPAGYKGPQIRIFQQNALEAVSRIPGVTAAAYASSVPLSLDQSNTTIYAYGTTDFRPATAQRATYYFVSPDYFRAVGTRLIAGRDFTPADNRGALPVAILNETLAKRVLGSSDGVGKYFLWGPGVTPVQVIGIVEDGKYTTLAESPAGALFRPILQVPSANAMLIARSARPENQVAAEMRVAIAQLDPHLPVYGTGSLAQLIGLVYLPVRAAVISLGAFGLLAILLAVTGIYGVASYSVSRRLREIGIRVAVGARPADVLRLIFGHTAAWVALGSLVGLALGMGAAQLLASIVYGASPRDPVVIACVALTMFAAGLAAAFAPARRALTVDPVSVLRQD